VKALLFVPKSYSLAEMLFDGFSENGWDVKIIDYKELLSKWKNRLYERTSGLPNRITKYWKLEYYNEVNRQYIALVKAEKPDLVFIYNNQFIFPETLEEIGKESKIAFFLGDNPLWSKTFDYNLRILEYSSYTICPDSHWQYELSSIGIPNTVIDHIGCSSKLFYPIKNIPNKVKQQYECDVLFIGRTYSDSSGYKRAMFLNSFEGMNMRVYGTCEWNKWLPYFPNLHKHFYLMNARIPNDELNMAINCCKVYPIDQNAGIVNGIHLRVFEVIAAGALPVMEWRKDIDTIFGELLPVIKEYNSAREIVKYYLDNEIERLRITDELKKHIEKRYTPTLFVRRIIDGIFK